jgi:hypothetical protein
MKGPYNLAWAFVAPCKICIYFDLRSDQNS